MQISGQLDRPIFQQIADGVEDAILSGAFLEGEQIPSITEFSVTYTINPATALKGITLLVDEGILFKKRGVGMFVAQGAREVLRQKRRGVFREEYVLPFAAEARRLGIEKEEAAQMLDDAFSTGAQSNGNA